jgi:hypothetical protein
VGSYNVSKIASKLSAKELRNLKGLDLTRDVPLPSHIRRGKMSRIQAGAYPRRLFSKDPPKVTVGHHFEPKNMSSVRGGIELHEIGHVAKGHISIPSVLARELVPGWMLLQEKQAWGFAERFGKHPISKKMALSGYKAVTAGQVLGAVGVGSSAIYINSMDDSERVKNSWDTRRKKYGNSGRRPYTVGDYAMVIGGVIAGGVLGKSASGPIIGARISRGKVRI